MVGFTLLKKILFVCLAGSLLNAGIKPVVPVVLSPQHPFPQHIKYAPGTIRPNQRTQAQQDNDVRSFYNHWKSTYLIAVSGIPARYRVSFGKGDPSRTVSEGQGYGMIITALMAGYDLNARAIFDGLWYFVRDHPSSIDNRLMAWEVLEKPGGVDSAFDGDADIAYSLLLADAQWNSDGNINYEAEAQQVITAIMESTIGPDSHLPMLGDWVNPDGNLYNQYTPRSSDFMPAHFRTYGRTTGDTLWFDVITATQNAISGLQANYSPNSGLLPDFIEPVSNTNHTLRPANANFLEGPDDGHYSYNAGRDPWRIGTDALLNNDPTSLIQTQRIADWIAIEMGDNPTNIKAGYYLGGTPLPGSDYFTTFFVAPFGIALMTRPSQQQHLNDLYNAVYNTYEDYYEDSVTLLSLLVMTGNYWDPTRIHVPIRIYLPIIFK
jgi:endo-1,4-beta-D-glucanase Y